MRIVSIGMLSLNDDLTTWRKNGVESSSWFVVWFVLEGVGLFETDEESWVKFDALRQSEVFKFVMLGFELTPISIRSFTCNVGHVIGWI